MQVDGQLNIPSMKSRCSAAEWQARVDLAACYRLVALYGMSDMMANHISARVPDQDSDFLHLRRFSRRIKRVSAAGRPTEADGQAVRRAMPKWEIRSKPAKSCPS